MLCLLRYNLLILFAHLINHVGRSRFLIAIMKEKIIQIPKKNKDNSEIFPKTMILS